MTTTPPAYPGTGGPSLTDFALQRTVPTDPQHWLEAAYNAPDAMTQLSAAATGILGALLEGKGAGIQSLDQPDAEVLVPLTDPGVLEDYAALEESVQLQSGELTSLRSQVAKYEAAFDEILAGYGKSRAAMAGTVRDIITKSRTTEPTPEPAEATTTCGDCGHVQDGAFTNCGACSSTNVETVFGDGSDG